MNSLRGICLSLLLILLNLALPSRILAQTVAADPKFKTIRDQLVKQVESGDLPSVGIAVTAHGKVLWKESLGWSDREAKIPASLSTLYPIASVSKSVTATGLMVLAEDGKVRLDDPITRYLGKSQLPESNSGTAKITVRQLLNQTSGIPHMWNFEYADRPETQIATKDLVARYAFPTIQPGTQYFYSNLNYGVVARVIEAASGQPIEKFMIDHVFRPSGMKDTVLDAWVGNQNVAHGYFPKGKPITVKYRLRPDGGAGFFSSTEDLLHYAMLHLNNSSSASPKVLKPETILEMHHEIDPKAANYDRYSMGWGIVTSKNHQILISDGRMLGSSAVVLLEPNSQIGVVVVTNVVSNTPIGTAVEILGAIEPGSSEEIGAYIEKMEAAMAEPWKPMPEGQWEGEIHLPGSNLPVNLTFVSSNLITVQLGKSFQSVLSDVSFDTGAMTGTISGTLPLNSNSNEQSMDVMLWRQRDELIGVATETLTEGDLPMYGRPSFVSFKRKH